MAKEPPVQGLICDKTFIYRHFTEIPGYLAQLAASCAASAQLQAERLQFSENISTHLLIMEVDFCPVLCILEVPVLQAFRGISHFV